MVSLLVVCIGACSPLLNVKPMGGDCVEGDVGGGGSANDEKVWLAFGPVVVQLFVELLDQLTELFVVL